MSSPGLASPLASTSVSAGHPLLGRFGLWLVTSSFALVAAFWVSLRSVGWLGWTVGFLYIAYDTWLLSMMLHTSRRAVMAPRIVPSQGVDRPTVAVLIAARNEAPCILQTVDAVLAQDDQPERIVVVDDGSTDATLTTLRERYALDFSCDPRLGRSRTTPTLLVLTKPNSGKARSLNEALAQCTQTLALTLDADTLLEPGAVAAVRQAFSRNPRLTVACGALTPRCTPGWSGRLFQHYQTFEYLRSFLWRVAWASQASLLLVSGAFAVFRRDALESIGGFDPDSMVEDYEVMFRLHRRSLETLGQPLEVDVLPDARASTDAPARIRTFLRQRRRWFAGFIQTMFRHHDLVGNERYGHLGRFHLRVKTLDTLLPLYGLGSTVALGVLLVRGRGLPAAVLCLLLAKLAFDFGCHLYSLFLHQRWKSSRVTPGLFARATLATLTEPLFFQILRQLGALLGWVAFLRGSIDWAPQR